MKISHKKASMAAALVLFAMAGVPLASAASTLTDLPTLGSSTTTDDATTTKTSATSASTSKTTAKSTSASSESTTTATTATSTTSGDTTSATSASSTTDATTTTSGSTTPTTTGSTSTSVYHLSNLPTIAGASIPTLVVPYTAAAPFMQKSSLPEGTVFIAIGAVLAFLGLCVVAWRGLIAWSINRSVKKAAMASMVSDSKSGWLAGGGSSKKGGYYHANEGSSLSLDALTSTGKPLGKDRRGSRPMQPSGAASSLFFSPTAQTTGGPGANNRSSSYLPAGYYASPSAQAAGGAQATTLGVPSHGFSRLSRNVDTTPPLSPHHGASLAAPGSNSHPLYSQASNSSLMVGTGIEDPSLPGTRAPSQYLDDLFENHGHGPGERF